MPGEIANPILKCLHQCWEELPGDVCNFRVSSLEETSSIHIQFGKAKERERGRKGLTILQKPESVCLGEEKEGKVIEEAGRVFVDEIRHSLCYQVVKTMMVPSGREIFLHKAR